MGRRHRRHAGQFLAGVAVAAFVVGASIMTAVVPPPGVDAGGYISLYRPPRNGFESLLDQGDGQAYAALAQDPTLARPAEYFEKMERTPPLAARPVFWGSIWVLSLGQAGLVPAACVLVEMIAAGLLVVATARLIEQRRPAPPPLLAPALLLLPGAFTSLRWFGPEVLALALVLLGLLAWTGDQAGRRGRTVGLALFVAAALTRELTILVPFVLAVGELLPRPSWARLRRVVPLALAPASYLVVNLGVTRRLGLSAGDSTALLSLPWNALVPTAAKWDAIDWVVALIGIGLVAAAFLRRRSSDVLAWMALAYAGLGVLLDAPPLQNWEGFSRVLLPMYVLALVALVGTSGAAAAPPRTRPHGLPGPGPDR